MRINDLNLTGATAAQSGAMQETKAVTREGSSSSGASRSGGSGDRVEFSSTLTSVSKALSSFGADRSEKVQALAAQYQSGNYHPDSLATAKGMVSEALSAGGK